MNFVMNLKKSGEYSREYMLLLFVAFGDYYDYRCV